MKELTLKTIKNVLRNLNLKECRTCLFTSDIAKIHDDGECEYCKLQDNLRKSANHDDWPVILNKIKEKGKGKKYDVLVGISGGEDSSVLLYNAVKKWNLRVLAIHFNNRTNRDVTNNNIKILRDKLPINFIEYFINQDEYNALTDSLLIAGVPDADIGNDVCMAKFMYKAAKDHSIKYILNGHSFRQEGSSPKAWSVIDYTYLESIYTRFTGKKLQWYPLLTVWDQIWQGIIGIRQVRPFHYSEHDRQGIIEELKKIGWQDYGGKHNENIRTAFIGNFVLPKKFGIDKRRTYLSARIREGLITKEAAKDIMLIEPVFNLDDLGERKEHELTLVNTSPIRHRSEYKMTNFKLYRPVFWLLMKFGVFPKTAFEKYCK